MTDKVRDAFEELRAHERRSTPEFEKLLADAPEIRVAARRAYRIAVPVATTALAAAIILVMLWPRHIEVATAPLIVTEPRAPSDSIVVPRAPDLMTDLPDLHESMLNLEGAP